MCYGKDAVNNININCIEKKIMAKVNDELWTTIYFLTKYIIVKSDCKKKI